jgi:protein-tyrosine-phosphatase
MCVNTKKTKVLFACNFYGARSLLAYEFAKMYLYENVEAYCCCLEKGVIDTKIYELMMEIGIEPSLKAVPTIFEYIQNADTFDYVITQCVPYTREDCMSIKIISRELVENDTDIILWPDEDFLKINAKGEQWMISARVIRDNIKDDVLRFMIKLMN